MAEYLEELTKREDLEMLRQPLREADLFPAEKDPDVAPISMEELKKLVRHWKLHEARGFWKMHPTKEDLVYALLEYMEEREPLARGPQPPSGGRPSKEAPRNKARRQSQQNLATFRVTVLKPHGRPSGKHASSMLAFAMYSTRTAPAVQRAANASSNGARAARDRVVGVAGTAAICFRSETTRTASSTYRARICEAPAGARPPSRTRLGIGTTRSCRARCLARGRTAATARSTWTRPRSFLRRTDSGSAGAPSSWRSSATRRKPATRRTS